MRTLVTTPCTLEPLTAAHAAEMFVVLSDPAIYEFENAPPASQAKLAERYARLESRRSTDGLEHWLNWVIRLADGRLAGYVQATVVDGSHAYVAYELNSQHWRQGLATQAVGAMLSELQLRYGVSRFVAVLKARNHRSSGLLRKLGFALGSEEEHARHRDELDESVMVMSAGSAAEAAV